jgi:hypothetical protein
MSVLAFLGLRYPVKLLPCCCSSRPGRSCGSRWSHCPRPPSEPGRRNDRNRVQLLVGRPHSRGHPVAVCVAPLCRRHGGQVALSNPCRPTPNVRRAPAGVGPDARTTDRRGWASTSPSRSSRSPLPDDSASFGSSEQHVANRSAEVLFGGTVERPPGTDIVEGMSSPRSRCSSSGWTLRSGPRTRRSSALWRQPARQTSLSWWWEPPTKWRPRASTAATWLCRAIRTSSYAG